MKKYILLASRVGAYAIDYVIFLGLVYILGKYGVLWYLSAWIVFFGYRYITTALYGATLGMKVLKLTMDKYSFKICLKREILRFGSAFYFIGYFYGIFDSMGRTFHDIGAGTFVRYRESTEKEIYRPRILQYIIYVFFVISSLKWAVSFALNDIGEIGLKKLCSSEEYFQSFDGDNLISYSQQQLYLNTLGRKYTAIMDFDNRPYIVRISNKLKYTEVYRLKVENSKILGEYAFRVDIPLQFICSGIFRDRQELCGISPKKQLEIIDEKGKVIGSNKVNLQSIISVKCGDLNGDKKSEIVVLGRNGDIEIFAYTNRGLISVYNRKIGEDIIPQSFDIDRGAILIAAKSGDKSILYSYKLIGEKFEFDYKKNIKLKEISNINGVDSNLFISNINRTNMMLTFGNTQRFEMYSNGKKVKRLYNFGSRPSRRYAYLIRNLEGVVDLNNDGEKEIVLKAVGKGDVMGHGYVVEVYKFSKVGLKVNRVLTYLEGVLGFKL